MGARQRNRNISVIKKKKAELKHFFELHIRSKPTNFAKPIWKSSNLCMVPHRLRSSLGTAVCESVHCYYWLMINRMVMIMQNAAGLGWVTGRHLWVQTGSTSPSICPPMEVIRNHQWKIKGLYLYTVYRCAPLEFAAGLKARYYGA